jgi:hypothetical protein
MRFSDALSKPAAGAVVRSRTVSPYPHVCGCASAPALGPPSFPRWPGYAATCDRGARWRPAPNDGGDGCRRMRVAGLGCRTPSWRVLDSSRAPEATVRNRSPRRGIKRRFSMLSLMVRVGGALRLPCVPRRSCSIPSARGSTPDCQLRAAMGGLRALPGLATLFLWSRVPARQCGGPSRCRALCVRRSCLT